MVTTTRARLAPAALTAGLAALFTAGLASPLAAAPAAPAQPAKAPAEATAPAVDPDALRALAEMGSFLRGLSSFQVSAATTDEDVLDDGQTIQYDGEIELLAERPNKLRVGVRNERRDRVFYYDGSTLTLFAQRVHYYAQVPAPPTILELATTLEKEHGFSLPLVDLFRWGADGSEPKGILAAFDAGPGVVGGVGCRHWAFRQQGVDWQVCIQNGKFPLPRKLVITTTSDPSRPRSSAVYSWNLAPSYDASAFTFVPPPGVGRVRLGQVN